MKQRYTYRHTQFGTVIVGAVVAALALVTTAGWLTGTFGEVRWALVVLAATGGLFHSLTVTIDQHALTLRFGVGLIRKRFPLASIRAAEPVRNPWYYGWGIHWTPRSGWVFNVSGFEAVELVLASGRRYRIGTDQPRRLAGAIRETMGAG